MAQDSISTTYTVVELQNILIPQEEWTPFPKLKNRDAWAQADQERLQKLTSIAETYLDYDWPMMPATSSLAYIRTGDRNEYQSTFFERRIVLGTLILAEIHENEGRFFDQIINGVWSICEESFWGVAAHLPKSVKGLANTADPIVDLFAAETATFLAWADYFFGEKMDDVTPQIRLRLRREMEHRIFTPLMTKYHWWMGPNSEGRPPNNWNPWICSNWINAALLMEKNDKKRATMVHKALQILDEFYVPYPADGGCDEGPSYWGAAAASLYDNISLLNLASNDAFRFVSEHEKFKDMGRFIYRAQIGEKYFLNFADADPQPKMMASMIYRYGRDIEDEHMMQFGAHYRDNNQEGEIRRFQFFRNFFELFIHAEFKSAKAGLPLPRDVYLPNIQVMTARDHEGTRDGFYLAAKGGHNDESHNHNDIGSYVVYYDGQPLVIDVGRGTYTRKTFSGDRYEIWYNRSDHHNLPTINGITQAPGMQYRANRVEYHADNRIAQFSLDISDAYPDERNILRYSRSLSLDRGEKITVSDAFRLRNESNIEQHVMTCYPPRIKEEGVVTIPYEADGVTMDFDLQYDSAKYSPNIEKIALETPEDQGIITKWGDRIYRITFKSKGLLRNDNFTLVISN